MLEKVIVSGEMLGESPAISAIILGKILLCHFEL
jgi:hypothetical protein